MICKLGALLLQRATNLAKEVPKFPGPKPLRVDI